MEAKTKFPLYFLGRDCDANKNSVVIVADLRKNTSRLAIYKCENGDISQKTESKYPTQDFQSFSDLAKQFLQEQQVSDDFRVSIAVPGPVINERCETPNLPWIVDLQTIKKDLQNDNILLINDLEAVAYSLADVYDHKFEIIHSTENKTIGNVAILAPGNGLGEAGLFYDGEFLRPFATEGGHTEFSPRNDFEVEFYQFLNKIYGIVSWEKVLSKEGLYNIYRFMRDVGRHTESEELAKRMQTEPFLDVIADEVKKGNSRLVDLTVKMFLEFLAREANNTVLKLKSTGGLIITGEIIDKIFSFIDRDKFYKNFMISDRMGHLLRDIPIYILRNENEIVEGAAYYGAFYNDK
ncbi:MAG: glucokinase [Cruoricaptor ignavus]|nr:glucokinase [Cruoricaptor ignavus]